MKINVLDHGFVRLVDSMGNDLSIVRAARVSYDAAWRVGEDEGSDKRLLAYLIKNKHTSPFEAVEFQFEVKAPIFVVRQWHRHRTWSYNELSGRYRELPSDFYVPRPQDIGVQSKDNKQARNVDHDALTAQYRQVEVRAYERHCHNAFTAYRYFLDNGWPRELARMVLPLSTYTHMFAKVNLHNLMHFLDLRDDAHAQFEIREYAKALKELARSVVPITMKLKYPEVT